MSKVPAAVLWDFDGTLIDSEPLWQRTHAAVAEELGGTWSTELSEGMHGLSWPAATRYLVDAVGRDDVAREYVMERWLELMPAGLRTEVDWVPGARELLDEVVACGVPCALVSASFRALMEPVVDQLPAGTFTAVVAGDDVEHGKPHPEPYLRAAGLLGVDPRECLVIEDSGGGVESGNAAGAVVLAIPTLNPIPDAPRRVVVPSLHGRSWQQVLAEVARAWDE